MIGTAVLRGSHQPARAHISTDPLNQAIADTGRWAALLRARESERPDALFKDPLALDLAKCISADNPSGPPRDENLTWPIVLRTYLIDQMIHREIAGGSDMVINLAAGLDTRPYRMDLPGSLRWVEVDLPRVVADKTEALRGSVPNCRVDRIGLDLMDAAGRRGLFQDLTSGAAQALILTEGLLVYLDASSVGSLAVDLAACGTFSRWIADLQLPGLLRLLNAIGPRITSAGVPLKFAPENGPDFFLRYGWQLLETHSIHDAAVRVGRIAEPNRRAALGREEAPVAEPAARGHFTGMHRWRVDGLACTFARA
jgi:methyltransferase (TIGR00027 family)